VPGSIDTELLRNFMARRAAEEGIDYDTYRDRSAMGVALQTISSTDDVANLVVFLASDESRTITGQSIPVDAGGYMQG
jgi:NAD(P)-dependent dehydrogenase (short-subunit alcohol dehydrogenase family)